jgi:hypothetical protein
MVKMSQKLLLAAALVTVLNFQSCKKYDDGPTFSLKTKKSRLSREWEVVKIYDNVGAQIFPYSGSGYSFDISFEFLKDGDFVETANYSYGTYSYSYSYKGTWEFSSSKENLLIELNNSAEKWKINRLTKKEFWFADTQGNEWELEAK